MVSSGAFPKPVEISVRKRAWYRSEVNEWIESLRGNDNEETHNGERD